MKSFCRAAMIALAALFVAATLRGRRPDPVPDGPKESESHESVVVSEGRDHEHCH